MCCSIIIIIIIIIYLFIHSFTFLTETEKEGDVDEKGTYILQNEVEKAIKELRYKRATGDDNVHYMSMYSKC